MYLFFTIVTSFKITELTPTLFCDYLRSGGDIFIFVVKMIFRNVDGVSVRTLERSWRVGQKILFMMNRGREN